MHGPVHSRLVCPGVPPNRPAAHTSGFEAPIEHAKPRGQTSQDDTDARLLEFENRPEGHGTGCVAPASQYEPLTQSRQPACPCAGWRLPGSHRAHAAVPLFGVGTAATGDRAGFPACASKAGCVACTAGGRVVRASLARCVRLTHSGGALGGTITARRAHGTGTCTHLFAEATGLARNACGVAPPFVVVGARTAKNAALGPGTSERRVERAWCARIRASRASPAAISVAVMRVFPDSAAGTLIRTAGKVAVLDLVREGHVLAPFAPPLDRSSNVSYHRAAPFGARLKRKVHFVALRSVVLAKRPPPRNSAELDWNAHCVTPRPVACAQRPPPHFSAWHPSKRVFTSDASEVSSATPPPAATGDDAVALASAMVTLDKCMILLLANSAPPYCGACG
eukprot:2125631-Prymnesium_polylepis.1